MHEREKIAVRTASERRLSEFTAGRFCAHQALLQLGVQVDAIPSGRDRAPIWPDGLIGSISHSRTCAVAVAAHATDDLLSLGIDVEDSEPFDEDLGSQIGIQQEYDLLSDLKHPSPALPARLLFSMKEAAFKCLYHWFRTFLEFDDLHLLGVDNLHSFTMGRMQRGTKEVLVQVHGRFVVTPELICCTAALHRRELRGPSAPSK